MRNLEKEILGYALKNAIEFGKADAGRIIPKLFQHGLKKEEIGEIMNDVKLIVDNVNSMTDEERKKEFEKAEKNIKTIERKEGELPELPNADGKLVFRIAPFPSGDLHIGNVRAFMANALYAEKYKGKLLLVIDDTIGSEEKQVLPEAYDLIKESLKWLGIKYDKKIIYKSDRIKIYYEYAEELIEKGKAYVCHCSQEVLKNNREKGIECACRQANEKEQLKRWKEMFNEKEGMAILRIKTDMQHPNPAFRDRVLFKISERTHPRVGNKYKVWPTLEMTWAIDDHLLGITHVIRGNDLLMESEMEKYIWDIFGWKHPEIIHTGLIKIEGTGEKLSKSKAQKEIESGEFTGHDDPRTWSIHSLKRRGLTKEAIREFIKEMSISSNDVTVPIETLYSINRSLIDKSSERHSFIYKPIELEIKGKPKIKLVYIPIHPEKKIKRKTKADKIFISEEDFKNLKGTEIRLLHLYNIKLGEKAGEAEFTSSENKEIPKINWVSENVPARVLLPNGIWAEGIAGVSIKSLKKDRVIQFERTGFARFDGKKKNGKNEVYEFWFAHK